MEEDSVIGDWIKQKELGCGSFGKVSWWRNLKTDENFAIKICKWGNDALLTPKHRERWTKEVEMMNLIKNDSIVATKKLPPELEVGLAPSNLSKLPILCMEYCSKGDLRQLLNQPENGNGLTELEVRNILYDMKSAVSYLHNMKITHRDLKPENIVLQLVDGNRISDNHSTRTIVYKLIDLGYAKEIDSNSVCASFVGTLQYLAPELLYSKTYSNTVDYWSFGLVAFEIICGIRPFLPNMPPVQWMKLVKVKTSDQICVFENSKGDVEYSNTVFEENNISSCFKESIEKWLRVALDWDPKRRGHVVENESEKSGTTSENGTPKPSSLVIFSLLESILSKKILTLFSVVTYEFLSYEIDESTMFATVQGWIERDIKVPTANQLFISHSQCEVDGGSPAIKYWNSRLPVMLYLYQNDCLFKDSIKPKIPSKLRHCLENPKLRCKYTTVLEIFSCSLYFIRMEKHLYDSLLTGYHLMTEHLKQEIRKLYLSHNESDKSICKLKEKNMLLSSILDIYRKRLAEYSQRELLCDYMEEYKSWSEKCKSVLDKINKLGDAWAQLTTRLQSVARRCNEIHDKDLYTKLNTDDYQKLQVEAYHLVVQVRKIDKEKRIQLIPCVDAVKVICKCLKARDKLLHNVDTQKMAQQIIDIHVETLKMSGLIVSVEQTAEELSADLTRLILEKENITLKYLSSLSLSNSESDILPRTIPEVREQSQPSSVANFRIGAAVSSPQTKSLPRDTDELQSLIKDNMSLRLTSQTILQKSYEHRRNILRDMDFSFLNPQ